MTVYKSKTIMVEKDAYMYLNRIERKQRGCSELTKEQEDKFWDRMGRFLKDGKKELNDCSLGGGDGTRTGKWWAWKVDTIKQMLDEAGFAYEDGKETEMIIV